MPIAATASGCCLKKAIARPSVSAGVVVANCVLARRSAGPVPTAQINFVPPASIPPHRLMGSLLLRTQLFDDRHTLDLHAGVQREAGCAEGGARRQVVGEEGAVHLV